MEEIIKKFKNDTLEFINHEDFIKYYNIYFFNKKIGKKDFEFIDKLLKIRVVSNTYKEVLEIKKMKKKLKKELMLSFDIFNGIKIPLINEEDKLKIKKLIK